MAGADFALRPPRTGWLGRPLLGCGDHGHPGFCSRLPAECWQSLLACLWSGVGGYHCVGSMGSPPSDCLILPDGSGRLSVGSLQATRWQDTPVAATDHAYLGQRPWRLRYCLHSDDMLCGW